MSRPLDAAIVSELSARVILPVMFVQLDFDAGSLYLHNDLGTITTTDTSPNKTWIGTGDLGNVGIIEESVELAALSVRLTLSAVDSTILDEALNNDYNERPVFIYIGVRNITTGAMVSNPHEIFAGTISEMLVTPSAIEVVCESEMAKWSESANQFYSNTHQQRRFSGDTFLRYTARMIDLVLKVGPQNRNLTIGEVERELDVIDRAEDPGFFEQEPFY